MDKVQRSLGQAYDHLADALEAATLPGVVEVIAKAMTEVERAEGMLERFYILQQYFASHPEINAKREAALKNGEPFAFGIPADHKQKLADKDIKEGPHGTR